MTPPYPVTLLDRVLYPLTLCRHCGMVRQASPTAGLCSVCAPPLDVLSQQRGQVWARTREAIIQARQDDAMDEWGV